MQELSDALRAATEDVGEQDHAAGAWAQGRRRRVRGRALAGLAAGSVAALALAGATVWRPVLGGPEPAVDVAQGTTTGSGSGAAPTAWTDPRLVAAAPAPDGERWVVLVLDRAGGPAPGDVSRLDGTSWRQAAGSTYPWTGLQQRVSFRTHRISLEGGCNVAAGPVTLEGDRLRAPRLAATQRGCADPRAGELDSRAADLVRSATAVLGDDGRLYLGGFVREQNLPAGWRNDGNLAPHAVPLATTTWGSRGPQTARGPREDG